MRPRSALQQRSRHAEVDRTAIELARAQGFFGVAAGDVEQFSGLASSRRLFGQPAPDYRVTGAEE